MCESSVAWQMGFRCIFFRLGCRLTLLSLTSLQPKVQKANTTPTIIVIPIRIQIQTRKLAFNEERPLSLQRPTTIVTRSYHEVWEKIPCFQSSKWFVWRARVQGIHDILIPSSCSTNCSQQFKQRWNCALGFHSVVVLAGVAVVPGIPRETQKIGTEKQKFLLSWKVLRTEQTDITLNSRCRSEIGGRSVWTTQWMAN